MEPSFDLTYWYPPSRTQQQRPFICAWTTRTGCTLQIVNPMRFFISTQLEHRWRISAWCLHQYHRQGCVILRRVPTKCCLSEYQHRRDWFQFFIRKNLQNHDRWGTRHVILWQRSCNTYNSAALLTVTNVTSSCDEFPYALQFQGHGSANGMIVKLRQHNAFQAIFLE